MCDAFMNKYICVQELIFCLFRDASLGHLDLLKLLNCKRNNNLKKPHPSTLGLKDYM